MADVFISYASEDHASAAALEKVLTAQGWSVWWDRQLLAGPEFDAVIQRELRDARAVVVLWSAHSVASRWVKAEAEDAAGRDVLVPAFLDADVEIPLGFRMLQAASLVEWEGGTDHAGLRTLVESVRAVMRRSVRELTAVSSPVLRGRRSLAVAAAVPLVAAGALSVVPMPWLDIRLDATVTEFTMRTDRTANLLDTPLGVAWLGADGISGADLPTRTGSEAVETDRVHAGPAVATDTTARLALSAIVARDTFPVQLSVVEGGFGIAVHRPEQIRAVLDGPVALRGPFGVRSDTLRAGLLSLAFGGGPVSLAFAPRAAGDSAALARDIPVRGLKLSRVIENRSDEGASEVKEPSTLVRGTIRFTALDRDGPALAEGDDLALTRPVGKLLRLALVPGAIAVSFEGRARDVTFGDGPTRRSLRPSLAGWLYGAHPVLLGGGVLAYAGLLVGMWRRRRR